jgi:hypothetical protein
MFQCTDKLECRQAGWDPIKQFNTYTFLCLSQASTLISKSNVMVFFVFSRFRSEVIVHFVDIGAIIDYHCLNFLFIMYDNNPRLQSVYILVHVVPDIVQP